MSTYEIKMTRKPGEHQSKTSKQYRFDLFRNGKSIYYVYSIYDRTPPYLQRMRDNLVQNKEAVG